MALLGGAGMAIVVGWLIGKGGSPAVVTYVAVGLFLMTVWRWMAFSGGWALSMDAQNGTLEAAMMSRTSLPLILLGRVLVFVPLNVPLGVANAVITCAIASTAPEASQPLLLLPAIVVTLVAVVAVAYALSPVMMLVRGRPGFFNAILPFVAVFSGFLAPVTALPHVLHAFSWLLPANWGMRAVHKAVFPGAAAWELLIDIAVALVVSAAWFLLAVVLIRLVERRVRVTGTLGVS